jgi:hypothetical protein
MFKSHFSIGKITAQFVISILILWILSSCNFSFRKIIDGISGASKSMTPNGNSLFHQTKEKSMQAGILRVLGEIENAGELKLRDHYKREVFVKESRYDKDGIHFTGAYRYRGYSLFDLLHSIRLAKKNAGLFKPIIDLYIVIENESGESVVFSWSEIFHTNNPHQIIIATESAPIEPYKKKVEYPVSQNWKVVAASDLFSYRTLDNPSSIKVCSFDKKEYPVQKGLKPMYSPEIKVFMNNDMLFKIRAVEDSIKHITYYSSFYGMGMGFHPNSGFQGPPLEDFFKDKTDKFDPELIRHALLCFVGLDGYRSVFSYSELFNRRDQVIPILSVYPDKEDGGYFRIFHPSDFYADRSVKSLEEIFLFTEKNLP